jgi:hypothetical protein
MSRTTRRFTLKVVVSVGFCGAALAMIPNAAAAPLKTGGGYCIEDAAGAAGAPVAAGVPVAAAGAGGAPALCAPIADMAGVPLAVPGPLPVGAAAIGAPVPVVVPPVPVGVPPVPVGVPPVPVGVPPVPVGVPPVPVGVPPVPVGAAVGAPIPVGAPILDMAGGKGAVTGPAPAGVPVAGQPIMPGPSAS